MINNNIKDCRRNIGFTQGELAHMLGVTRQTIIAIENNKYNPSLELAYRICQLFKKSFEEVFYLADEMI